MVRRRPRRPEDGDLGHLPVGREHLEAVPHLLEGHVRDLEVAHPRSVLEHLEHRGQHLAVEAPRPLRDTEVLEERVDTPVGLVGLELIVTVSTHVHSIH